MLSGNSGRPTLETLATRPNDGLVDASPQRWAGQRIDPPRSLPAPSADIPEASAAASPPLEPPGVRSAAHGLIVAPAIPLSVCQRSPMSGSIDAFSTYAIARFADREFPANVTVERV
jgi:hypothetical protein